MGAVTITNFAVAFYLGASLKDFFGSISRDIVAPFIGAIFPSAQQSVDKITIQIGPVKISIGDAIGATINLAVAYLVLMLTLPYVREYAPVGGRMK
jgi:large-conductance mechanosensitive channel